MVAPGGQGHEPPLIAQETIRSISYLSNFSTETKATLLPSQIAEHLFHEHLFFFTEISRRPLFDELSKNPLNLYLLCLL